MTVTLGPSIVGNHETFYFTGLSTAGVPEDITGDTLRFRAFDGEGNEITKSTDDDIVIYTQSGDTLGRFGVPIVPADWPDAWLALPALKRRKVIVITERITAAGLVREQLAIEWTIVGQGIVAP